MMEIINHQQIEQWLTEGEQSDAAQAAEILQKAAEAKGLTPAEVAVLLHVDDTELLNQLYATAERVKERIYGKRVVLFAPLYLSNECTNNCLYCGFRYANGELERRTLNQDQIRQQVEILLEMGHKRLLLESGEDLTKTPIEYVLQSIATVYATTLGKDRIRRVNINIAATTVEHYRLLKESGIGTYQLFQESYHRPSYQLMHPSGPKANYDYHLTAMDRAMQGGIDDVGIGALFGLYDHRFEVLGLMQHIAHLQEQFGVGPHTISVPRLRVASGQQMPQIYPLSDLDFKRMVAILRLAVPYTGIILSTRESAAMRNQLLDIGISQMSAASATSPGGYQRQGHSSDQFELADHRSLLQIIQTICRKGYLPSFCTSCYRLGRTGEHFMEMAKDGQIQTFCQPNAIITLAEYLADHADQATREQLNPQFEQWLAEIKDDSLRQVTRERLDLLASGQRDLYL
jgi:2-iminoacetate synthase